MDKIIEQIAEEYQNPDLRADLIHYLWNSLVGASFDSPEEISEALSKGDNVALIAAARERLGLPLFE